MTDPAAPPVAAPAPPPKPPRDPAFVLMLIVAGLFNVLLLALLFIGIPSGNKDIVVALAGALVSSFTTVVGFYFGSSSSSRAKDQTISSLTPPPKSP